MVTITTLFPSTAIETTFVKEFLTQSGTVAPTVGVVVVVVVPVVPVVPVDPVELVVVEVGVLLELQARAAAATMTA